MHGFSRVHGQLEEANEVERGMHSAMREIGNCLPSKVEKPEEELDGLQALFDGIDEVIYVTDPQTYEILFANKKTREMFGEKIIGKKCYKTFQNLSQPCAFCTNKHILGKNLGKTYRWEFQNRKNRCWYKYIDRAIKWSEGKYARYEIAIDITESKKMEERLHENEEFFRSVVENSVNAILIIDDSFRIIYANNKIEQITGYSRRKIVGQDFRKYLAEESKALVQERYLRRQSGEKVPSVYQFKVVRRNGAKADVEIKSEIIRYRCGKTCTIAQLLDITDREKLENERKQFEERLSALNLSGEKLNRARNFDEIYELTLDAMERTLGFTRAAFMAIDRKNLYPACHRGYPTPLIFQLPLDGSKKGITVKVAVTRKPFYTPDIGRNKDYVPGDSRAVPARSEIAVPVMSEGEVLGVLNVESVELDAFDEKDLALLQILASHAATAISNLKKRDQLRKLSSGLEHLMKSNVEVMHAKSMRRKLKTITKAIRKFGWRRAVISLRDENLDGIAVVTAGLTAEENKLLMKRKAPGSVWRERLGPDFEKFKIGEFYYLPWKDPWIRENVHGVGPKVPLDEATTYTGVPSRLSPEEMVDWHPQDMLYAPLCTPEGRIVGILSIDDPLDGRKPTMETLTPLELFCHQTAIIIENEQLVESLKEARKRLQVYADQLEQKVEEKTRELKRSEEQLLKAQRLAVIGELAGMVGHDLRNPLTGIAGATYYVKKRLSPKTDVKIKEMLELTEKNIEYSNKIINDLLDYSREITLDLTATNPKSIVGKALSFVKIPKNIKLINLVGSKPRIKVDIEKMTRAFANIIRNAVEAMPHGGKLTIKCQKLDQSIQFLFSDTGTGMSKETVAKVWSPLFTTKAKGMGFGLPICKRIVEAHCGTICAASVFKKGTAFTVTIPCEPKTEEGGERLWVTIPESLSLTMTKT
jgi:PAS domain S-box-containing protein